MGPELDLPRAPAVFAQVVGEDFAPVVVTERCAVWSLNSTVRGGTGTHRVAVKVCACVHACMHLGAGRCLKVPTPNVGGWVGDSHGEAALKPMHPNPK